MSTLATAAEPEPVAVDVRFDESMICVTLEDGREVRTPLEFYPRLAHATADQLENYRLIGGGTGVHWESLDEDLSVASIVAGRRAFNLRSSHVDVT